MSVNVLRDAAAKGKIERFFRRVRDQFLIRKLDLSSIQTLNKQFSHWVESDYNATVHSVLGMKPIDRFGVDLSVNQDIKSRVTYSVITKRLGDDAMRSFIERQLDRMGLAHSTFTSGSVELIVRTADGVLRRCRNLCLASMLEAVRASSGTTIMVRDRKSSKATFDFSVRIAGNFARR